MGLGGALSQAYRNACTYTGQIYMGMVTPLCDMTFKAKKGRTLCPLARPVKRAGASFLLLLRLLNDKNT